MVIKMGWLSLIVAELCEAEEVYQTFESRSELKDDLNPDPSSKMMGHRTPSFLC